MSEQDRHSPPEPPSFDYGRHQGPEDDERAFKKARTYVVISNVSGPLSLIIGGVLLSSVGLVLGILSFRQLRKFSSHGSSAVTHAAARLRRSSVVGICLSATALVLNLVAAYLMFPVILEMLQNGTYPGLPGSASTGSTSAWG